MLAQKRTLALMAVWLLASTGGYGITTLQAQDEPGWIDLASGGLDSHWREPAGDWFMAAAASLDEQDSHKLASRAGRGTLINGATGRTRHLFSQLEHGDIEAHIEFMVPEGSNSGVYFQGRYEIQVFDSWGVEDPKHSDCGGIYHRWAGGRGFEGHPPRTNASRRAGLWQSFDVIFRAPRFDERGNKLADARFDKVVHNGQLIHENVEVSGPTRAAAYDDERPTGPLMLQGDHGPVAYRNVRIRHLEADED